MSDDKKDEKNYNLEEMCEKIRQNTKKINELCQKVKEENLLLKKKGYLGGKNENN